MSLWCRCQEQRSYHSHSHCTLLAQVEIDIDPPRTACTTSTLRATGISLEGIQCNCPGDQRDAISYASRKLEHVCSVQLDKACYTCPHHAHTLPDPQGTKRT